MVWLETLPDDWWKPYESVKLSSQCIQELTIELLFIVRSLLLETRTYARVCKRICLLTNDFQNALDARNIHRSIYSTNDIDQTKESIISIESLLQKMDELSPNTSRIQLTMHWLAIDGEQPIIPENPFPSFNEENSCNKETQKITERKHLPIHLTNQSPLLQKLYEMAISTKTKNDEIQDHIHPLAKNNLILKPVHPRNVPVRRLPTNTNMTLSFPPSSTSLAHELSIEQQSYFKSLTESCFHRSDEQRTYAFHCLSSDASLQPLLPRLLLFICKGIQTNIYLHELNFIHQFLSMLNMLTQNKSLVFDKYLHLILPSLLTCLLCLFDISKTTNLLPTIDQINMNNNSIIWLIREQASDLIYYFQSKYSTIPYITQRIVSIIKSNLTVNHTNTTYSIVYACVRTLFLIDIQMYSLFGINILKNYKKEKVIEADFDLDHNEQETLFNQKMIELFKKYDLSLKEM